MIGDAGGPFTIRPRRGEVLTRSFRGLLVVALSAVLVILPGHFAVANIGASSYPQGFVNIGGVVLFSADDGTNGRGLWRTDGTEAGTTMVADVNPMIMVAAGSRAFFTLGTQYPGNELWVTDGTPQDTHLVRDFSQDARPWLSDLAPFGADVVLTARTGDGSDGSLWKSDGTEQGTVEVASVLTGTIPVPLGSNLYFVGAEQGGVNWELWTTDGTAQGTFMVRDLNPGPDSGVYDLASDGTRLWLTGNDGTHGFELWTSDGTAAGTRLVKDIVPGANTSFPMQMTPWHGDLLFSASDGAHGREPWISDGTAGGTLMLRDFSVGARSSNPLGFSGGTTRAVFLGGSRHTLRRTDGTSEGTRFLTSSDGRRVPVANYPKRVVGVGFLFAATSALDGELWVTKGWRAGTRRVKDINPGAAGSYPADFIDLTPGEALFHASDGVHGDELWITDGTATGTKLVRDINPA